SGCLRDRAVTELAALEGDAARAAGGDIAASPAGSAPAGSAPAGSAPAGSAPAGSSPAGSAAAGAARAGAPEAGPETAAPAASEPASGAAAADAASVDGEFAALDARFAELRASAGVAAAVAAALGPETEDTVMPGELGDAADHPFAQDPPPGKNPRVHASLRLVLDARTERHRRWAFRAIASGHPNAVQSRLRKAAEASGLDAGRSDRQLFVLRNAPWPNGKKTEQETARLTAKGGVVLPASAADLGVFAALAVLEAEHHPALNGWLADRQ